MPTVPPFRWMRRTVFEKGVGVLVVRVLREDEHSRGGMPLTNQVRSFDPLARVVGWHPDIGQDGVGSVLFDG